MKPYASYKPSGVAWLGEIPTPWALERLRFRVRLNPSFSKPLSTDLPVSFLPMEAIGDDGTLDLQRTRRVGEVASGYTYFEDGDVAIAKITPCYENGKGAVLAGLAEGVGFGTTELIVMRPTQNDCPQWLYYLTMCSAFRLPGEAFMQGAGGQKRVPDLFVKDYFAPIPPPDEQQAIADYLDTETARIDTLVQEKEELIGLLREWRQSMIAEAVTKGMEKTVVFNSHPDPWIGFYPTHWKLKKLKYLGAFRAGAGFPVELQGQVGNPLPFFKVKDIDSANEHGVIRESDSTVTPETALSLGAKVFPPDAIVFAKVGAALLLNRFRLLGVDSCIDNNMMGLELNQEIAHPRFMLWAMQRINFSEIVNPGTVPSLNEPLISNLQIVVPPPDEQQAIAKYLDDETAKIDALITHTQEEIALLKELRAATIADAVLGRVDVRPLTQKQ